MSVLMLGYSMLAAVVMLSFMLADWLGENEK